MLVFAGDNGTGGNYGGVSTIGGRRLSGEKGSKLERGANVPLFINWPGRTRAERCPPELVE